MIHSQKLPLLVLAALAAWPAYGAPAEKPAEAKKDPAGDEQFFEAVSVNVVSNLAKFGKVDRARISRITTDQHFWLVLFC